MLPLWYVPQAHACNLKYQLTFKLLRIRLKTVSERNKTGITALSNVPPKEIHCFWYHRSSSHYNSLPRQMTYLFSQHYRITQTRIFPDEFPGWPASKVTASQPGRRRILPAPSLEAREMENSDLS